MEAFENEITTPRKPQQLLRHPLLALTASRFSLRQDVNLLPERGVLLGDRSGRGLCLLGPQDGANEVLSECVLLQGMGVVGVHKDKPREMWKYGKYVPHDMVVVEALPPRCCSQL